MQIFGATEEDIDRLRIVTLHDIDLEKAFGMTVSSAAERLAGAQAARRKGAALEEVAPPHLCAWRLRALRAARPHPQASADDDDDAPAGGKK